MRILRISTTFLTAGALACTLFAATGNRPVTENGQSPTADTSIKLGTRTITVEYNAPSARGRKVEGGLIPYDQWYRLGADSATTITSDAPLTIGDLKVPAGAHTLFLYATEKNGWKLIVNKETKQWGLSYKESEDLGRTPMKVTKLATPVERFKLTLAKTSETAGTLSMDWGTTHAEVPLHL